MREARPQRPLRQGPRRHHQRIHRHQRSVRCSGEARAAASTRPSSRRTSRLTASSSSSSRSASSANRARGRAFAGCRSCVAAGGPAAAQARPRDTPRRHPWGSSSHIPVRTRSRERARASTARRSVPNEPVRPQPDGGPGKELTARPLRPSGLRRNGEVRAEVLIQHAVVADRARGAPC